MYKETHSNTAIIPLSYNSTLLSAFKINYHIYDTVFSHDKGPSERNASVQN
jgi:hypothetical protein